MTWPAVGPIAASLPSSAGCGNRRDVELAQQPQQPVGAVGRAEPAVEVEAGEDLSRVTRPVQLVDLRAVPPRGKHVGEGGAQVAQRDVQLAAQVDDPVQLAEPGGDLWPGARMREGPGVVRGVAGPDQVTALARRPAPLTGQLGEYPVEDRRPRFVRVARRGDEAALVQVDHRDIAAWSLARKAVANRFRERRELVPVLGQEVDKAALVDGDQACLVMAGGGPVRERGEELLEDLVVGAVTLVLAAVVVRAQQMTARQGDVVPVRARSAPLAASPGSLAP